MAGEESESSIVEGLEEALAAVPSEEADPAAESAGAAEAVAEETTEPSCEDKLQELTDDLQRLSAEYANYRRRTASEREAIIASAKGSVLTQLLPVLDGLDLAEQHGDVAKEPLKAFSEQVRSAMNTIGLERFTSVGDVFDPDIHEAVQDSSSGDVKVVAAVLRSGYRYADRVLRTAMVLIGDPQGSQGSQESQAPEHGVESEARGADDSAQSSGVSE